MFLKKFFLATAIWYFSVFFLRQLKELFLCRVSRFNFVSSPVCQFRWNRLITLYYVQIYLRPPLINLLVNHCFQETWSFVWRYEKFDELRISYSLIFFAETSHTFTTYHMSTKVCVGFFILFRSWVIYKNFNKAWFLHTRFLHFY